MNSVLPVFRSSYSLLYGTSSPEEIIRTVQRDGYFAFLIADRNNLYGCYDAYFAAREIGIKPLIGATVKTHFGEIILICQNHGGFKNLSRLITDYQLNGTISPSVLKKFSHSLICLSDLTEFTDELSIIYAEKFYIQLSLNHPTETYRQAEMAGYKTVASPPVGYLSENDYSTFRLLRAIRNGELIDNLSASTDKGNECLRTRQNYETFYAPFPKAMDGSREIINNADLIFPERKNILPNVQISGDHYEKLKSGAIAGLNDRVTGRSGSHFARLEYELSVIKKTGFVDYFLIVSDIVEYCRKNNFAVVGRGSAAGSLVSYSLGITQVDPIIEGLYFERFLNEARRDCPDIDLDIDWRYRDDVLDYIYQNYGAEKVAMMATYTRFRPRLAIRETAKVYGLSPDDTEALIKSIPYIGFENQEGPLNLSSGKLAKKLDKDRCKKILLAAQKLVGLPRHLGIHSGGIVITPEPLTDYVPLERATKGIVVTQCDMYQAEKIGLVKIDILGQRGLAVIADCYKEVRNIRGENFVVPRDDQKTFRTLQSGKTIGVFQIESPGLRALLRDLKPKVLNDITLALALIRPGASESGMKKIFLKRFHGEEKTVYPHQRLVKILRGTFGVFIYQEQVILAAREIAGFNLAASDLLRRAITKKRKKGEQKQLTDRFLDGATKNRIDKKTAESIYKQLRQFASFGFCKAHAATYGFLAQQSAYFKTHYPSIFMTAVLRNGGGYYPSAIYVAEARRLGIPIKPPDLNLSDQNDSLQSGNIYLGLHRIRDLTGEVINRIRINRPFISFEDFISRIKLSENELEQLIRVGFFDSVEPSRTKLFWLYRLAGKHGSKQNDNLFGERVFMPKMKSMPPLNQFNQVEIFRAEKNILNLSASFHPLRLFCDYQNIKPEDIYCLPDKSPVSVSGWRADIKRIKTKNGQWMVFLTFETLDDTFEVILFPNTYGRYREIIGTRRYLRIDGFINREEGNPAIVAEKIHPAPTGLKEMAYV